MLFDLAEAMVHEVARSEMVLHIWSRAGCVALHEAASLANVRSKRAALEGHIAHHIGQAFRAGQSDWLRTLVSDGNCRVVLQIRTYSGQVMKDRDIQGTQMLGGTNTGQHQQLR